MRVVGPLIGRVGRRQEQTIWANLNRLLEAGDDAPHRGSVSVAKRRERRLMP